MKRQNRRGFFYTRGGFCVFCLYTQQIFNITKSAYKLYIDITVVAVG